jgi:glycine cleavage system H protein
MTFLIAAAVGLFTLVVGILIRLTAAVSVLGLLLVPAFVALFCWYWATQMYDGIVGIRRVGSLFWRRDSYYTPGHMWLRPMSLETVRVGVDDIAQRVLPEIDAIALPEAGTRVRAGEPIADLRFADGHITLRAPVAGTIAAANPRLVNAPVLLHRDPYRRGWFVDITSDAARLDGFVAQGRARVAGERGTASARILRARGRNGGCRWRRADSHAA